MYQSVKLTGAVWLLQLVISSPLIYALVWPESSLHWDSNPGTKHERQMTYQLNYPYPLITLLLTTHGFFILRILICLMCLCLTSKSLTSCSKRALVCFSRSNNSVVLLHSFIFRRPSSRAAFSFWWLSYITMAPTCKQNIKNLSQSHGASILGCEPIDGVLGVLSSNQINIATVVHQMGHMCISHLLKTNLHAMYKNISKDGKPKLTCQSLTALCGTQSVI